MALGHHRHHQRVLELTKGRPAQSPAARSPGRGKPHRPFASVSCGPGPSRAGAFCFIRWYFKHLGAARLGGPGKRWLSGSRFYLSSHWKLRLEGLVSQLRGRGVCVGMGGAVFLTPSSDWGYQSPPQIRNSFQHCRMNLSTFPQQTGNPVLHPGTGPYLLSYSGKSCLPPQT